MQHARSRHASGCGTMFNENLRFAQQWPSCANSIAFSDAISFQDRGQAALPLTIHLVSAELIDEARARFSPSAQRPFVDTTSGAANAGKMHRSIVSEH